MKPSNNGHFKIAFLGGALNSAVGFAHYSAIGLVNQFEIVAGCFSRQHDLNLASGIQYGVKEDRIYPDLAELLKQEKGKISAIIILTPTDQHAQQVLDCISAGIPVICEKALGVSSEEIRAIKMQLARQKGFLKVIYNYLGYPMLRELKDLLEHGKLGNPRHIQIEMPLEGFKRITSDGKPVVPQSWRLHDGLVPTISLDLGVHLHIIIKYLTGQIPSQVVSMSESLGNFSEVQDNVSSLIQYPNGLVCNMWYSKIAIGKRNGLSLRLFGELGSAEWVQENPEYLSMADNRGNRWIFDRGHSEAKISNQPRYTRFKAGHPAGFIEAMANYYDDIAEELERFNDHKMPSDNPNCFGADEAFEGLSLFEAMSRSNSTKSWQEIGFN